jgi:hypothetical protein
VQGKARGKAKAKAKDKARKRSEAGQGDLRRDERGKEGTSSQVS